MAIPAFRIDCRRGGHNGAKAVGTLITEDYTVQEGSGGNKTDRPAGVEFDFVNNLQSNGTSSGPRPVNDVAISISSGVTRVLLASPRCILSVWSCATSATCIS